MPFIRKKKKPTPPSATRAEAGDVSFSDINSSTSTTINSDIGLASATTRQNNASNTNNLPPIDEICEDMMSSSHGDDLDNIGNDNADISTNNNTNGEDANTNNVEREGGGNLERQSSGGSRVGYALERLRWNSRRTLVKDTSFVGRTKYSNSSVNTDIKKGFIPPERVPPRNNHNAMMVNSWVDNGSDVDSYGEGQQSVTEPCEDQSIIYATEVITAPQTQIAVPVVQTTIMMDDSVDGTRLPYRLPEPIQRTVSSNKSNHPNGPTITYNTSFRPTGYRSKRLSNTNSSAYLSSNSTNRWSNSSRRHAEPNQEQKDFDQLAPEDLRRIKNKYLWKLCRCVTVVLVAVACTSVFFYLTYLRETDGDGTDDEEVDAELVRANGITDALYAAVDADVLDDSSSPQAKAMQWLIETDKMQLTIVQDETDTASLELVQRFALVVLYYATNGDAWEGANGEKWMTEDSSCEWVEDACNADGEITAIDLGKSNLQGSLPEELYLLTRLRSIFFSRNFLTGTFPPFLSSLVDLEVLELDRNRFSGTIPYGLFGGLTNLEVLTFDTNSLSGTMPSDICSLPSIVRLTSTCTPPLTRQGTSILTCPNGCCTECCDRNNSNDRSRCQALISPPASSLPTTTQLVAPPSTTPTFSQKPPIGSPTTALSQTIMNVVADKATLRNEDSPQSLAYKWLLEEDFEYSQQLNVAEIEQRYALTVMIFATALASSPTQRQEQSQQNQQLVWIDTLGMHECKWTTGGQVTRKVIECDGQMRVIRLLFSALDLTGAIPPELYTLTRLRTLDLRGNDFTGTELSPLISNLSDALTKLDFANNEFSFTLPPQLYSLTNLKVLDLGRNELKGSLLEEVGNLTELTLLNLRYNLFTGEIPSEFAELTQLEQLNIEFNSFEGTIPSSVCKLRTESLLTTLRSDCGGSDSRIVCGENNEPLCCTTCCDQNDGSCTKVTLSSTLSPNASPTSSPITLRASQILNAAIEISGSGVLMEDTPQSRAARWMIQDDSEDPDSEGFIERYALAVLYFSTGGDGIENGWSYEANWLSGGHVCDWNDELELIGNVGVTFCDGNDQVTRLNLSSNNLAGSLPKEIYMLSSLTFLNLYGNSLSGTINPMISNLSKLRYLLVALNEMTGNIPVELFDIGDLSKVVLKQNYFSGKISNRIGELSALEVLHLDGNQFTGTIPSTIGNLEYLQEISLEGNDLVGIIPSQICSLRDSSLILLSSDCAGTSPQLECQEGCCTKCCDEEFACVDTTTQPTSSPIQLTTFPTITPPLSSIEETLREVSGDVVLEEGSPQNRAMKWLVQDADYSSMLENTDDDGKTLRSVIQRYIAVVLYFSTGGEEWIESDWLGSNHECEWSYQSSSLGKTFGIIECDNNKSITRMDFTNNNLNGTIPEEFYLLNKLRYAQFFGNELSGSISPSISKLTSLQNLLLTKNSLTSYIPDELYSLYRLQKLVLTDNELTGTISKFVGSMPNLVVLDVRNNIFTGALPQELEQLSKLGKLYLQGNKFVGEVPQGICDISTVYVLEAGCSISCSCCTAECFAEKGQSNQQGGGQSNQQGGGQKKVLYYPTKNPTYLPTKAPIDLPTDIPTIIPTKTQTSLPTSLPTKGPADLPTSSIPTKNPTDLPTKALTDIPTYILTTMPTKAPTSLPPKGRVDLPTSSIPTKNPTGLPTKSPIDIPTTMPTRAPISLPTKGPVELPTI